jgi:DNA-binding LacI/PurR family transcriptional regulator
MIKGPTIKDLSRLAGVSISTVSRVINNHPDLSGKTREKVMRAIEALNYRPNRSARQLVRNTSETICFVLSNREVINAFHARILVGVEKYVRSLSQNLIFIRFDYSAETPPEELVLPPVIWERGAVDGLVIAGTNHPNFIQAVRNLHIPFVVLGNNITGKIIIEDLYTVWFDSEGGMRQATEYLIGLKHEHICCFADATFPWYRRCYEGYETAMKEHGLRPRGLDIKLQEPRCADYGYACVMHILRADEPVTAIVAGDDEIALGALAAFNEKGIRVPKDISIVGSDDIDELKYVNPGITTIRVDREKLGEELSKLLFERLQNPKLPPMKRVLSTEFVIRQSCAPPGSQRHAEQPLAS